MGASIPESYYKYLGSLPCKQPILMAAMHEVEKQANKQKSLDGSQIRHKGQTAECPFTAGNSRGKYLHCWEGWDPGTKISSLYSLLHFKRPVDLTSRCGQSDNAAITCD